MEGGRGGGAGEQDECTFWDWMLLLRRVSCRLKRDLRSLRVATTVRRLPSRPFPLPHRHALSVDTACAASTCMAWRGCPSTSSSPGCNQPVHRRRRRHHQQPAEAVLHAGSSPLLRRSTPPHPASTCCMRRMRTRPARRVPERRHRWKKTEATHVICQDKAQSSGE
eukprot:2079338-Rhodomonas_salina.5